MSRIKIEGGGSWPCPARAAELEYQLRHNREPLTTGERMVLAGIVEAYVALAIEPRFERAPRAIRRAMLATSTDRSEPS